MEPPDIEIVVLCQLVFVLVVQAIHYDNVKRDYVNREQHKFVAVLVVIEVADQMSQAVVLKMVLANVLEAQ